MRRWQIEEKVELYFFYLSRLLDAGAITSETHDKAKREIKAWAEAIAQEDNAG